MSKYLFQVTDCRIRRNHPTLKELLYKGQCVLKLRVLGPSQIELVPKKADNLVFLRGRSHVVGIEWVEDQDRVLSHTVVEAELKEKRKTRKPLPERGYELMEVDSPLWYTQRAKAYLYPDPWRGSRLLEGPVLEAGPETEIGIGSLVPPLSRRGHTRFFGIYAFTDAESAIAHYEAWYDWKEWSDCWSGASMPLIKRSWFCDCLKEGNDPQVTEWIQQEADVEGLAEFMSPGPLDEADPAIQEAACAFRERWTHKDKSFRPY